MAKARYSTSSRLVTAALIAMIVFFLFGGSYLSRTLDTLKEDRAGVARTGKVLERLRQTYADLLNAEAGERAFLIIRDEIAYERLENALADVDKHLTELKRLVVDSPEQSENLGRLEQLIDARMKFSRDLLAQARGEFGANKLSKDYIQLSRAAMKAVRDQIDTISRIEEQTLTRQSEKSIDTEAYVRAILIAFTSVAILALIGVYFMFRRFLALQTAEIERQRLEAWLKDNEAKVSQLAVTHPTVEKIAEPLLRLLTDGTRAVAGNLFLLRNGKLALVAGYGVEEGREEIEFTLGRGFLGEMALAENLVAVDEVPRDHFRLQSGLVEGAPSHLVFVPLRFQGEKVGLVEIASFSKLDDDAKAFLSRLAPSIAAGFSAAQTRDRLQNLLEETQVQAEELQAQQEELKTANEELLESQARLQSQQEELQQNNEELEQQTRVLEDQQEFISKRNEELEKIRRELEAKATDLERASTYKSEFLAKMSHELRTPLNSLMILATLLKENKGGNLSSQQIEFASTIHDAGADLLNLINDILDLSKLEARKLVARPENFDLRALFEQLGTTFRPLTEQKNLQFQINVAQGTPEKLHTDRQRLQQVLTNFLSNAVKFTERGNVVLEAKPAAVSERMEISVSDTGAGIPEEKQKLIFDAFEQVDGSISRRYGGTGLGLTIARELANLLGGRIKVTSEPEKGSRFTIEFPVDIAQAKVAVEESPSSTPVRPAAPAPLATTAPKGRDSMTIDEVSQAAANEILKNVKSDDRTILIVEDDLSFQTAIADSAREHGFVPVTTGDAETALAVLKSHVPKAIMLDIKLPGMSGLTLLEVIKQTPDVRHVPVHMVSALEYQRNALRLGAIGYLGKPVSLEGVNAALGRLESVLSKGMRRLLIVEDDVNQRKAIQELVTGKDVEVVGVGTSRAALDEIDRHPVDCIILDLTLPDMSGHAFLEHLNKRDSRSLPPVIVYTGKELSREEVEALQRYSDSIIIKGAKSPDRLLDEVSLFLHRIESTLPAEKREILANLRHRERAFDGRTVLVVDDDLRNVFALTSALESKGFRVEVARNGVEALEKLEKVARIDVVLMDIMMPKMDGFEAMKRIRAQDKFRTLPIIALTAKTMKGEQEKCIRAGASDYLPKPINLMNLISAIKAWLPREELEL